MFAVNRCTKLVSSVTWPDSCCRPFLISRRSMMIQLIQRRREGASDCFESKLTRAFEKREKQNVSLVDASAAKRFCTHTPNRNPNRGALAVRRRRVFSGGQLARSVVPSHSLLWILLEIGSVLKLTAEKNIDCSASALSHHSELSLTHVSLTLMFTFHLPLFISSHRQTPMYISQPHVSTLCLSVWGDE